MDVVELDDVISPVVARAFEPREIRKHIFILGLSSRDGRRTSTSNRVEDLEE